MTNFKSSLEALVASFDGIINIGAVSASNKLIANLADLKALYVAFLSYHLEDGEEGEVSVADWHRVPYFGDVSPYLPKKGKYEGVFSLRASTESDTIRLNNTNLSTTLEGLRDYYVALSSRAGKAIAYNPYHFPSVDVVDHPEVKNFWMLGKTRRFSTPRLMVVRTIEDEKKVKVQAPSPSELSSWEGETLSNDRMLALMQAEEPQPQLERAAAKAQTQPQTPKSSLEERVSSLEIGIEAILKAVQK